MSKTPKTYIAPCGHEVTAIRSDKTRCDSCQYEWLKTVWATSDRQRGHNVGVGRGKHIATVRSIVCGRCSTTFEGKPPALYCSDCRKGHGYKTEPKPAKESRSVVLDDNSGAQRAYNVRSVTLGTYTCAWCETVATRPAGDAERQKYCSPSCAKRGRGKVAITPEIDPAFGHYFAGLTDGEGTFGLLTPKNGLSPTPVFAIKLRDDDRGILEEIQRTLGFGVLADRAPTAKELAVRNSNPQTHFSCTGYATCKALVDIFRKFPLRAKKARDFSIWAEAVELGCQGENIVKLRELEGKLKEARKYPASSS